MPGLSQEAFSIVTQILEFWQLNYFSEGIQLEQEGGGDLPVVNGGGGGIQKLNNPDRVQTPPKKQDSFEVEHNNPEPLKLDGALDGPGPAESAPPAAVVENTALDQEQKIEKSVQENSAEPEGEKQESEKANVASVQDAKTFQQQKHQARKNAKLVFGKTVSPKLKADGSWNFHTVLRFIKAETYTFETIFCRPSKLHPVPKATASVWFQLIKDADSGIWKIEYRFEHTHQIHTLKFDESVTFRGFEQTEKDLLAQHAALLAPPLKRMVDTIESKILSSQAMDFGKKRAVVKRNEIDKRLQQSVLIVPETVLKTLSLVGKDQQCLGICKLVQIKKIQDPKHPANGEFGLFSLKTIPPKTYILDYKGVITSEEYASQASDYILHFDGEYSIDAQWKGNEARFLNDYRGIQAKQDVQFQLYRDSDSIVHMGVFSIKEIKKGQEICINYGKGFWKNRGVDLAADSWCGHVSIDRSTNKLFLNKQILMEKIVKKAKATKSKSCLLIYPNSLFYDQKSLDLGKRFDSVYLVEEPFFFGSARNYSLSKIKLSWMRATLKYYQSQLKSTAGLENISYIEFADTQQTYSRINQSYTDVSYYDTLDWELEEKLSKVLSGVLLSKMESKLFLNTANEIKSYFDGKSNSARYIQGAFYSWMKGKLGILHNVSSKDEDNRKPLPKNHNFKWSTIDYSKNKAEEPFYEEAKTYINSHPTFKDNIGSTDLLHLYPINEEGAKAQLEEFLEKRLENFGPYEDAVDRKEKVLFHSFLSAPLNAGLVSPKFVLDSVMEYKGKVPINSLEGFVRQLIGWREYQRGIYTCFYQEIKSANHFNSQKRLNWDYWLGKKTMGIEILDNEIKKALKLGYSHHIPRLMIFLNIFVLMQVRIEDVIQWFSQVVSMDAYPWVMYSNIASMGFYDTRFMQKPYVSTSAYLLKMTNYPKGPWQEIWTALFYTFLHENKKKLVGGSAVYLRNLVYFEKKGVKEQDAIKDVARSFTNKVTI